MGDAIVQTGDVTYPDLDEMLIYGTNPTEIDTDGGGVSDGEEVLGPDLLPGTGDEDPTDPLNPADDLDSDGDFLSDNAEARLGTNPLSPDTDYTKWDDAIAATSVDASTGRISFNGLGEVRKDVQVQIVKDGNWHHYAVISDPVLLAPPEE